MKKLLSTVVVLTTSLSSAVALAGQPITTGINVASFIGSIQQSDKFYEKARIIEGQGYTADWSAAIGGAGTIIGDDGNIQMIKIFSVAFRDSSGIHRASIIGGIIGIPNSVDSQEFIIIAANIDCSAMTGITNVSSDLAPAIKPLIGAIKAGDRSRIWSIILDGTMAGSSIRTAFESSGTCNSAPAWFPEKSIWVWYAATCPSTSIRQPQGKEDDQKRLP